MCCVCVSYLQFLFFFQIKNTQKIKRTLFNWIFFYLKSVLLVSCVLDLFSERWQSTLFKIFSLFLILITIHTFRSAPTHQCRHPHTHACTQTYTRAHFHTRTHEQTYTRAGKHIDARAHTHTHTHTHMRAPPLARIMYFFFFLDFCCCFVLNFIRMSLLGDAYFCHGLACEYVHVVGFWGGPKFEANVRRLNPSATG